MARACSSRSARGMEFRVRQIVRANDPIVHLIVTGWEHSRRMYAKLFRRALANRQRRPRLVETHIGNIISGTCDKRPGVIVRGLYLHRRL